MSESINGKPPMSFRFIGCAALIWNLFGMYIYVDTVSATPESLAAAGYTAEQVDFLINVPNWATSAFAIAVTTGVVGCLFLLMRKVWAFPMFVISLAAVVIQNVNTFVLNDTVALFGIVPVVIQSTIAIVGLFLIWFSRLAKRKTWIG